MHKSVALVAAAVLAAAFTALAADAPTSQPAKTTASGLTIAETGADEMVAQTGDKVWVEYTGKLQDGTVFDASSRHPDQPFLFTLGKGEVIRGWDEGITGMKVGAKRTLTIPPNLGYGDRGVGPIPPNSTLIFDVQLLGVKKG